MPENHKTDMKFITYVIKTKHKKIFQMRIYDVYLEQTLSLCPTQYYSLLLSLNTHKHCEAISLWTPVKRK